MNNLNLRNLHSFRQSIVCSDSGLFPVTCSLPDLSLACISRTSAGHLGVHGSLQLSISRDSARSWSAPTTIASADTDIRNPAFGAFDSLLLLLFQRCEAYSPSGTYLPNDLRRTIWSSHSTDLGQSWSSPSPVPTSLQAPSPYGKLLLHNHCLYTTAYGLTPNGLECHLLRSTDFGLSFSTVCPIARGFNECSLLSLPNGELLACLRAGPENNQALFVTRSLNLSQGFSTPHPITQAMQHPADLALLSDNSVLVVYGNRKGPFRIEALRSTDLGHSFHPLTLLLSPNLYPDNTPIQLTDFGYPSIAFVNEQQSRLCIITYYARCSPHSPASYSDGPSSKYSPKGYQAISLSFDESELFQSLSNQLP